MLVFSQMCDIDNIALSYKTRKRGLLFRPAEETPVVLLYLVESYFSHDSDSVTMFLYREGVEVSGFFVFRNQ